MKKRKRFINEHIRTPSPILAYSEANELKFSNENIIINFLARLNLIWIEAVR